MSIRSEDLSFRVGHWLAVILGRLSHSLQACSAGCACASRGSQGREMMALGLRVCLRKESLL